MSRHSQPHDNQMTVTLQPEITRVFWSKERAWYGDDVKLFIETRWVPDGTRVEVSAHRHPRGLAEPYDIDLRGDHRVQQGRCVIRHRVRWDARPGVGVHDGAHHGSPEFVAVVRIDRLGLEVASDLLLVDLPRFRLST